MGLNMTHAVAFTGSTFQPCHCTPFNFSTLEQLCHNLSLLYYFVCHYIPSKALQGSGFARSVLNLRLVLVNLLY